MHWVSLSGCLEGDLGVETLRAVFVSLVRVKLEICSVVWSPHQLNLFDHVVSGQNRFLRLVKCKPIYSFREVPLSEQRDWRVRGLRLEVLARHRGMLMLCSYRVLTGQVDCWLWLTYRCQLLGQHAPCTLSTKNTAPQTMCTTTSLV